MAPNPPAGTKAEKPSFAKVAAAGLKLSNNQTKMNQTENAQKSTSPSSTHNGGNDPPSTQPSQPATATNQTKQVGLTPISPNIRSVEDRPAPKVLVEQADAVPSEEQQSRSLDGLLSTNPGDEANTQLSSSNDSVKPPSLDGKSVASGTTFTLDEKESLRPDDSASVMAREDEDSSTQAGAGLPEARTGSDDGRQAFSDQLREISDMDSTRPTVPPHVFGHGSPHGNGVLYVPPQGPGVGSVPGSFHLAANATQRLELPPDPKLLEALDSPKDRIMVLKLEQDIVDFVKDPKESSLKLPQTNAFYRMLAHRLADYYMLGHVVDESTMAVRIFKTPNCRIPPPLTGIATPSTAASTPPPAGHQMKILRRGIDSSGPVIANGSNYASKATSENSESGNEDERKAQALASREEREARYEAARKRIMGSEQPPASTDETLERDNSRSSSAAGKRTNRKKQRADSDDDFEARSAYSTVYGNTMTPGGSATGAYALPQSMHPQPNTFSSPYYGSQGMPHSYQQYGSPATPAWSNSPYPAQGNPMTNWSQPQQPGYDLNADFQRSMSFQSPQMGMQNTGVQQQYSHPYAPSAAGTQQGWAQHSPYASGYPNQAMPGYSGAYSSPMSPGFYSDAPQAYAYGQLPSQTFPGRPPSKLEHPLPGSYQGKHFDPQSQSFTPAQGRGPHTAHFQPAGPSMHHHGGPLGFNGTPRQDVAHNSPAGFGATQTPSRNNNLPMTHPLPQPIFPQQPSPNLPLPAKPVDTPSKPPADKHNSSASPAAIAGASNPSARGGSSIAKWGAPASLPAKPPPSNEPLDPAKFQRQPSGTGAASHRLPNQLPQPPHGMPTFGSMPPAPGGGSYGVNGQHVPPRRI